MTLSRMRMFFFFSSRRRHTRSLCDWSSDVCSSDLESLQFMNLPAYAVGGAIHLVVNNQIGYTTLPEEGRTTRYCTDIAKTFRSEERRVGKECRSWWWAYD